MTLDLEISPEENRLIEYSQEMVVKYNMMRHQNGGQDTLYSFLLSDSGNFYDGASYVPNITQATVYGERCAMAAIVLHESYSAKIRHIVVADPVPDVQEQGTPPCGTCRHLIWFHGTPKTTVLLMQYIQGKHSWTFPKIQKFAIQDLYPHPYEPNPTLWENWQPR